LIRKLCEQRCAQPNILFHFNREVVFAEALLFAVIADDETQFARLGVLFCRLANVAPLAFSNIRKLGCLVFLDLHEIAPPLSP
jgi:hypothetical protein